MKLSISWVFDHIIGSWKEHDIHELVEKLNVATAEIDHVRSVTIDLSQFTLVHVTNVSSDKITCISPEHDTEYQLPHRSDVATGQVYALKLQPEVMWATCADWGSEKEGLLPALSCGESDIAGEWKNSFESEDYILDVDNTSITHRPDLWSHRGMAREIAALLDKPLIPEETLLATCAVKPHEHFASATKENPFTIAIKDTEQCSRFAGLYVPEIGYRASWLWMAHRLVRVDSKPIDAIVDTTNYVMFDVGQPMHAFDAKKITTQQIAVSRGPDGKKMQLLDGDEITLHDTDLVVSDGKKPIALAGVMGGADEAVSAETNSLFIESACFDPVAIRRTATRVKKRTDASTRFEKGLDPNQNVTALLRFLKLVESERIPLVVSDAIISLGHEAQPQTLSIAHDLIEKRLGVSLEPDFIIDTLSHIGFKVVMHADGQAYYKITAPTFRFTRDLINQQDIIEEIGRFYGYTNIPLELPTIKLKPKSLDPVYKLRTMMQLLATAGKAREVQNYALYDEQFLDTLSWRPEHAVYVDNPISKHYVSLATSLIPHLLKNVGENVSTHEILRFFEWNTVWQKRGSEVIEQKQLAGIFFAKRGTVNFYKEKEILTTLFNTLKMPVSWKKEHPQEPWWSINQTAGIYHGDVCLGYAGKIDTSFLSSVADGDAFIFAFNGDALLEIPSQEPRFKPLPKYPGTYLDISMLVPVSKTIRELESALTQSDGRVTSVELLDFFEKKEWGDKRSVTLRVHIQDAEKTLDKEAIDHVYSHALTALQSFDVEIR